MKLIFRRLMAEKRKSVFKHPCQCRRNRTVTPDLLSPYLPGPELLVSPPMLSAQTRPVYSTARFCGSLSNASPFMYGYSSSVNPMVSLDSNSAPPNSGLLHTESSVVEDLSTRSTAQSILSLRID